MSSFADPMIALIQLQQALNEATNTGFRELNTTYRLRYDEFNNGKRFLFAKVVNNEVLCLSIFGLVDPINSIECWAVGYAVSESHRRRGLASEAFHVGLDELKKVSSKTNKKNFYIEAVIDNKNKPSIKLAEKLFSAFGENIIDEESGNPALWYKKLIIVE